MCFELKFGSLILIILKKNTRVLQHVKSILILLLLVAMMPVYLQRVKVILIMYTDGKKIKES